MSMHKVISNALGLASIAALALAVWGGIGLTHHAIVALDAWGATAPDLKPTLAQTTSVLTHADTAVKNLADATGDWSDASKQQARDVRAGLAASGRLLDAATEDAKALKPAIVSLQGTADAATGTLHSASDTLQTVNSKAGPLLDAYTQDANDLHDLLKGHVMLTAIDNFADTTGNFKVLSGDFAYYAHPILHPDPCTTRKCVAGRVFGKIAGYAGIAADGARLTELWRPIPVQLK